MNTMNSTGLELAFRKACEQHEHLKLLDSQWNFDKELISKALQNISALFPHYSRHDASHSKQIIVNIERMLGERINYLTATDMWLILEAAYSHDIGMVVTHKQIEDLDTLDFKSFVSSLAEDEKNALHGFAIQWQTGTAKLPEGASSHEFFNQYKQLLAEWYRKKHPENSAKIIRNPLEEIGLTSPRNELLPKRLFGALASICDAHGQSFEEVMKLPFSEAGMATDDCHPRYVAFLLRMGDLLDVDDNRFCPVMMKMSGSSLPSHSHSHFEKHQAIRHFRLDSERIKIESVCPTPESYEVAYDWFKWLEREYHSQSQHWPKIVPNSRLGRLPTLSPPKVVLAAPYLSISEGHSPSFEVDQDSIIQLLRSTGLYTSKLDSIREILQNAVDSTLLSIWDNHKEEVEALDPTATDLFKLYDKNPIEVTINKNKSKSNEFNLRVKDFGMGISMDDLRHMLKIGNIRKKSRKTELMKKMPEWFKPSGNFGIGLQSIYLLSKEFQITTKSRLTNEAFRLTFKKDNRNSIVIENIPGHNIDYGASVSVNIDLEDFPENISISFGKDGHELLKSINQYDFTIENSNLTAYEEFQILQAISNFNANSPVKIKQSASSQTQPRRAKFFSKETNILVMDITFHKTDHASFDTFFRGQPFSGLNSVYSLFSGAFDFCGQQALKFLTYSREKILPEAKSQARKNLKKTVLDYIDKNYPTIPFNQKPYAAAFYYIHCDDPTHREKYHNDLKDYEIIHSSGSTKLIDIGFLIKIGKLKKITIPHTNQFDSHSSKITAQGEMLLIGNDKITSGSLIKTIGTTMGLYWQEDSTENFDSVIINWSENDQIPVSARILEKVLSSQTGFIETGNRMIFPAWGEYRKLSIEKSIPWARIHRHVDARGENLLLPYKLYSAKERIPDTSKETINWIFENRKHKNITYTEIENLHLSLYKRIEEILQEFQKLKMPNPL